MIEAQLKAARKARKSIGLLSDEDRKRLILAIAQNVLDHQDDILKANAIDAGNMDDDNPKKDRLVLDPERLGAMASQARDVAGLPDPTGEVLLERTLENQLQLQKVSVALGVVGIIYESRPNVTLDAAVLALRSGNGLLLKGSREADASNKALVDVIQASLASEGLPREVVQLLPPDREVVQELIRANGFVDLVIPRGSKGLIDFVRDNATVPTIETGAGVCHTYVHASADLEKAVNIIENAKTRRPSVCNAMDTLLIDEAVAADFLPAIAEALAKHNVEIFADEAAYRFLEKAQYPSLQPATQEHFGTEFLSLRCSVKVVSGIDQALEHIQQHSSKHSEAIVAEDIEACERFLREVDAASVYSNASTYFSDGGCYGLGAEIGISTQKLHARGPFALEKLVCEKWVVRGSGHIRT